MKHAFSLLCIILTFCSSAQVDTENSSEQSVKHTLEFDQLYLRYTVGIPVGSFYSKADAGLGSGLMLGQIIDLHLPIKKKIRFGIDHSASYAYNPISLGNISNDTANVVLTNQSFYSSYDYLVGPSFTWKRNNDIYFSISFKYGANMMFAPLQFNYELHSKTSDAIYHVYDTRNFQDNTSDTWLVQKGAITCTMKYKFISFAVEFGTSKFQSTRLIELEYYEPGYGYYYYGPVAAYTLTSRSSMFKLMIGVTL